MIARLIRLHLKPALLASIAGWAVSTAWAGTAAPRLEYQAVAAPLARTGSSYLPGSANSANSLDALYRQAAVAGIDPNQAANIVTQLPGNAPLVFGRYAAATGRLVVEVYKVERVGASAGVYRAAFTPAHGALWANAGTYKAPGTSGAGADPFAEFADAASPGVFVGASFDAVEVILGHAMRYVGSPTAVLAVAVPRSTQTMTTQRNAYLRKTVQTTITNSLEPQWFVAAPPAFQSSGSSAAICLHISGSCIGTPYLIAPAMVTFQEWQGGTMPTAPTGIGAVNVTDSSHFVFEDFLAAAQIYAFAAGGARSALHGTTPDLIGSLVEAPVNEAGLYAGLPAVLDNGSLTTVQESFRGSATRGRYTPDVGGSEIGQQFASASESHVINANPLTGGMQSVRGYYVGACDPGLTVSECEARGQASGVVPRKDTYVELDAVRFYQDTIR